MRLRGVAFLFAWLGMFAVGSQAIGASKGGSSPEEAVALMAKAAKAGDVDGAWGMLVDAQSKTVIDWTHKQADLATAINDFADALEAKFGKDANSPIKRVQHDQRKELAADLGSSRVVGSVKMVDANTAEFEIEGETSGPDGKTYSRKQPMQASKTESGWKIVMPGFDRLDFPASIKHMDLLISNLKRGTKGVKAGEIKNRADAEKEVEKDVPKSIPGNVPMPRFLTRGG